MGSCAYEEWSGGRDVLKGDKKVFGIKKKKREKEHNKRLDNVGVYIKKRYIHKRLINYMATPKVPRTFGSNGFLLLNEVWQHAFHFNRASSRGIVALLRQLLDMMEWKGKQRGLGREWDWA